MITVNSHENWRLTSELLNYLTSYLALVLVVVESGNKNQKILSVQIEFIVPPFLEAQVELILSCHGSTDKCNLDLQLLVLNLLLCHLGNFLAHIIKCFVFCTVQCLNNPLFTLLRAQLVFLCLAIWCGYDLFFRQPVPSPVEISIHFLSFSY